MPTMQTDTLEIADGLALPLEAATRRMAILAMSGAGKSNAAVVLAEAMYDAGIPWVAIDPKGDWWGVRSSADGEGPGLPVPIFGGLHGDLPLEPSAGKQIAELVVRHRLTCVLDVSDFIERQDMWRFLRDFGATLYRLKARDDSALHLFLEEADEYIPQSARSGGALPDCLGTWQRVVKRGRNRGIGSTQITQRSATLNKDTLYQAELLIALRATGKRDRDAVGGWLEYTSAEKEIVDSLPTLDDGEAWATSPAWLRMTKRVQFHRRRTYDSGSTPVVFGGNGRPPATLADIDLAAISAEMEAAVERAKADDPDHLRSEIRRLTAEIATMRADRPDMGDAMAVLDERIAVFEAQVSGLMADARRFHELVTARVGELDMIASTASALGEAWREAAENVAPSRYHEPPPSARHRPANPPSPATPLPTIPDPLTDNTFTPYARELMTAAAQRHPATSTAVQIALGSGRSHRSSQFQRVLRDLVAGGSLTLDGRAYSVTPDGLAQLGDYAAPPSGAERLGWWMGRVTLPERPLLDAISRAWPGDITAERISEVSGRSVTSSAFGAALRTLRDRGLIEEPSRGAWRATDDLMGVR